MTSSASWFLWAISLLWAWLTHPFSSPAFHSSCWKVPVHSHLALAPDCRGWAVGNRNTEEAPPSLCVLCIRNGECRQSLNTPLLSFSMELGSTMSKAVTLPQLRGVGSAHQPVIMCVILCCWCKSPADYYLPPSERKRCESERMVHPLGAASCVPPLASLCAYTCNSVLIILGVNMSCVLLNELVTRSLFTWRISEKKVTEKGNINHTLVVSC